MSCHGWKRQALAALCAFVLCFAAYTADAGADEEITSATPAVIDTLRKEAARDRSLAEQQMESARVRRDLEIIARRNAARTSDPLEKRWWLDDLAGYVAKADELEDYARNLRRQADTQEARAARLQAALSSKN